MDGRSSLGDQRAGQVAPPCHLQVSRIPPVPLVGNRAVPISLLEICMWSLERQLEGCLRDAGGGHSRRSRKLEHAISLHPGISSDFILVL